MADISKLGEKGKDVIAALERVTVELSVSRVLIIFFLFCDCFMVIANGRSFLDLKWEAGAQTTLGAAFLALATFSFSMTVVAPFCLRAVLFLWAHFGAELAIHISYGLRSHFHRKKEEERRSVEKKPKPLWTEPPSLYEEQLEKNLVPLYQLREYALKEQNPTALKLVEKEDQELRESFQEFKENSRNAAWSIMAILLTALDYYLAKKNHPSALGIIGGKLQQVPGAIWLTGLAYLAAIIVPLVEYIRKDVREYIDVYAERHRKPVFYPLLAEKLLPDVQRKRREKEESSKAFHDGWRDAQSVELVCLNRPDASPTLQIAERLRALVTYLGRCEYRLEPEVTPVRVAKLLRYENVATLEAVFAGRRPFSFSEANLICRSFGTNRKWLLEDKSTPFKQKRRFRSMDDFFEALALDQLTWGNPKKPYHKLLFILPPDGSMPAIVYGQRQKSAYCFDLLLDNVPIYGQDSSGIGLFDFCLAAAHICRTHSFGQRGLDYSYSILDQRSFIPKTDEQYLQISQGRIHPSWIDRELPDRRWVEDIWDLEFTRDRADSYTKAFAESYRDFLERAERHGIINNEQLLNYIDGRIVELRRSRRPQSGTQESTVDA
jgi:hypothetical protein